MKSVVLVSNPSEVGAGTRGSSLGFDALRIAGWKTGNHLLNQFEIEFVENNNHAIYSPDPNPFAHRIASIRKVFEATADVVTPILESGKFPLVIGGDHSVAAGTIAAIKKAHPEKRLGVIWIDAHADLHTPYTTPSGNFHGMPLAISLGEDNLEERSNTPVPQTVKEWNEVKGLWGIVPKVLHSDVVFYGLRSTEAQEDALIARHNMRNFEVKELRQRGIQTVATEGAELLQNCDIVYISFDVDSMDPAATSHGTGTPVPGGFTPEESVELINELFNRLPVVCFEMVEINPTLDEKGNAMAEISIGILEKVVAMIKVK